MPHRHLPGHAPGPGGARAHAAGRFQTTIRRRRRLALAVTLAVTASLVGGLAVSAQGTERRRLLVSSSPGREGARALDGSVLTRPAAIFLAPTRRVTRVEFFLDGAGLRGTPVRVDRGAPFDLGGGAPDGRARLVSPAELGQGSHRLVARVTSSWGGTRLVTAAFRIGSGSAAGPSGSGTGTQAGHAAGQVPAPKVGAGMTTTSTTSTTTTRPPPSTTSAPTTTTAPRRPSGGTPGAANTGVPDGVTLRPSGPVTVSRAGTVLDGLDIRGCVTIAADDVTVKRSRIRCDQEYPVRIASGARGALLEDVEINGLGNPATTAVGVSGFTVRRADIHGVGDGPRLGDDTVVEDSWIHGLAEGGGSHNDGLQSTGGSNIVIRNNRIENPDQQTSCILIGADLGDIDDVLVEGNLLNGGNYTVYAGADRGNTASDIRIVGNRFGRDFVFGPKSLGPGGITWSGNVWADTGAPVR
jgi:hypothetical protein